MRREMRELLGTFFIILGAILYVVPVISFMEGTQNQLHYQRCLTSFILGLVSIPIGWIVFLFKTEKKVISIFFSLSASATFICLITNFALFMGNQPTINWLSISNMVFFILACLSFKKYCS